jgi:hypothetical protein
MYCDARDSIHLYQKTLAGGGRRMSKSCRARMWDLSLEEMDRNGVILLFFLVKQFLILVSIFETH